MFKVIFVLLIISCIAPLFIEGPDGKPLMTVEGFKAKVIEVAGLIPGVDEEALERPAPDTVYKWQDEDGNWHFGDAPQDITAEAIELGPVNSMSGDPTAYLEHREETAAKDVIREQAAELSDDMVEAAGELQRQAGQQKPQPSAN